jgi:hypothetical protein
MKLRLKGNSIRLRLGPREVEQLVQIGAVTECLAFGSGLPSFTYTLELSTTALAVSATYGPPGLQVSVPQADARRWAAATAEVSLIGDQDAGGDRRLSILIEKDFECLHGEEVVEDAFPNPAGRPASAQRESPERGRP